MSLTRIRPKDGLYGPAWAARYLKIARTTLHEWVKRGDLVPTKYVETKRGREMRFDIEYLKVFREKRVDYGDVEIED